MESWPEEETVNVTWKYFDNDEEPPEDIAEEEIDTEINSIDDVKVNDMVDVEIDNKEHWNNVDSDDSSNDGSVPGLIRRSDKKAEYDSSDDEYDSDDESVPPLECRDDMYIEYDLDESTVQSMDERVQSNDIPKDMTNMMVKERQRRENVTLLW